MIFLILFLLSYYTPGTKTAKPSIKCNGVVFRNIYHEKQLLFQGLGPASNMMMHEQSGELFFSHPNYHKNKNEIMGCRIERRTCRRIKSVKDGRAIAYDHYHKQIYFGGSNGIYKFNHIKKTTEYYAERNKSIFGMYIRKNFYYIDQKHRLYVNHNGGFIRMHAARNTEVDNIFVSKLFEIYMANKTGLYKTELQHKDRLTLMKAKLEVRQITEDTDGKVYFCAKDGIYIEDAAKRVIKKVANINQPEGMTFVNSSSSNHKNNQLIYSTKHGIYRLQPSKHNLYCLNALGYIRRVSKLPKIKATSTKTNFVSSSTSKMASNCPNISSSLSNMITLSSRLVISTMPVNRTSKSSFPTRSSTILTPVSSPTFLTTNIITTPDKGSSVQVQPLPQNSSSPSRMMTSLVNYR